jgi:hypothetical protein
MPLRQSATPSQACGYKASIYYCGNTLFGVDGLWGENGFAMLGLGLERG